MAKIGKPEFPAVIIVLLFALAAAEVRANEVEVQASLSQNYVRVGEYVDLHIEVKAEDALHIERPSMPSFSGARLVSSTPTATTRYRVEDGRPVIIYRFAYQLQGVEEGLTAIPSAGVDVDGTIYYSNQLDLRVLSSGQTRPPANRRAEMFLQKELSDENPVRGQQITADIVVYFRDYININNYQVNQGWNTEGFWQEDMSEAHQAQAETVFLDGIRYRRAVLMRHAVFPTRSETMRLQPYEITINVRARPGNTQSEMFGGGGRSRDVTLETDAVDLQVRPLPEPDEGQFVNAVGELSIERSLNRESIRLGETVEVITEITGSGNLELMSRPEYEMPSGFDSFRPGQETSLDKSGIRITGTKTFRDVLIARQVGTFTIPEAKVAVYNDLLDRYQVKELPELEIEVQRNPDEQIGYTSSGDLRISPVRNVAAWLQPEDRILTGQWWFWVGIILPLFIISGGYQYRRHQQKTEGDATLQRKNNALRNADNLFQEARRYNEAGDVKHAYALVYRAMLSYITDKLDTWKAGYTNTEIVDMVRDYISDKRRIDKLEYLLDKCSNIRYANNMDIEDAAEDIDEAHGLLIYLNNYLR